MQYLVSELKEKETSYLYICKKMAAVYLGRKNHNPLNETCIP